MAVDDELLARIKARLPELKELLGHVEAFGYEDRVYRYYHGSGKVYSRVVPDTGRMVEAFRSVWPERGLDPEFMSIVQPVLLQDSERGSGPDPDPRQAVEALFHAHYFLRMLVKYGETLPAAPMPFPSGWASVLYLYNLRH